MSNELKMLASAKTYLMQLEQAQIFVGKAFEKIEATNMLAEDKSSLLISLGGIEDKLIEMTVRAETAFRNRAAMVSSAYTSQENKGKPSVEVIV